MGKKEEEKEEKIDTSKKKQSKEDKKEGEGEEEEKESIPLDQEDIKLLMRYGRGPYFDRIKDVEDELKDHTEKIIKL
jgi:NACalpha-BTF3-like transcription factor